jgi:hypothetical protein
MASQLVDTTAKTTMVEIAERYDLLADAMLLKEAMRDSREAHRAGRRTSIAPQGLL